MPDSIKQLLTSRLTQLAARYVGGALVTWGVVDAAQAETVTGSLVVLVVGGLSLLADLVIHKINKKAA